MKKVLIIDDEEKLRSLLGRIIHAEGFDVTEAGDCKTALGRLEQNDVAVVLSDVKLPDGSGVDLVRSIRQKHPLTEIILMTAYGKVQDGVQAMKNGAFDYIVKGDENEKIVPLLHRAFEKFQMLQRLTHLEENLSDKHSFDRITGRSKVLLAATDLAKKVAGTDTTVLLTGETGTGKEVFARAIHQSGNRYNKNFVAINCAAFSKELLESEMFGHKAGAFTGATRDKKGLFEEANNGTIFLDEIGEMPPDLQAKLLRVLESGELMRVGETKTTKVNVRVIAATNRDLEKEIRLQHFRQDLFYRLSVFGIRLPALRERISDIEALALNFVKEFALKTNKHVNSLSDEYLQILKQHHWPGNIRELKNVIERSVILSSGEQLSADTLPLELLSNEHTSNGKTTLSFDLATAEKSHIRKVMSHTNGNKTEAARLLNIALTTLYRKLEEYRIS